MDETAVSENVDTLITIKKSHLEELRFYGFAGICIIRFQQVFDHLSNVFSELVKLSDGEVNAIFGSIRTLDRRCKVIGDLLKLTKSGEFDEWSKLAKRIRLAERNRDSIAHGSPVYGGGRTTIIVDEENQITEVVGHTESFFYLERNGSNDWNTDTLLAEARHTQRLLSDLYAFSRNLRAGRDT
ncbi:MAG: hypothetical protein M3Q57_02655 [Pseudomonadota bacterium]|nr:hypothetical protein [Pseudomonadota bacterium]